MTKFVESIVVYYSPEDESWIAHGLRTDQIGIASAPVDALPQLLRLVDHLVEEADADQSILVYQEAPAAVQQMALRVLS